MSADYELGTVAFATVRGVENVRVTKNRAGWWTTADPVNHDMYHGPDVVSDVRPLVTLDPEDHKQVERFTEELFVAGLVIDGTTYDSRDVGVTYRAGMADRVREALLTQSKPRPPKPPEPQGLGAVVEDSAGKHFVRIPDGDDHDVWFDNRGDFFAWESIDAVRVLSEGVQP